MTACGISEQNTRDGTQQNPTNRRREMRMQVGRGYLESNRIHWDLDAAKSEELAGFVEGCVGRSTLDDLSVGDALGRARPVSARMEGGTERATKVSVQGAGRGRGREGGREREREREREIQTDRQPDRQRRTCRRRWKREERASRTAHTRAEGSAPLGTAQRDDRRTAACGCLQHVKWEQHVLRNATRL
eukprot:324849-Rhodomonas_salina.1